VRPALYPEQELKRRALRWSVKLKVNPRVIRIQSMTRKWGSCSSGGIVTFAEDLVAQEELFQDYVIVHELLHIRIPNHGRMFKALMNAHVPGWRQMDEMRFSRRGLSSPKDR
jgi:predicted metal-dependent hydrolase